MQRRKLAVWRLSIDLTVTVTCTVVIGVFAVQAARADDWSVTVGWTLALLIFALPLTVLFAVLLVRVRRMKE